MPTSAGAKLFGTEELLSLILSSADRESLLNVMVSSKQGLVVGSQFFWREGTADMLGKLGTLMCPPNRLALYCQAVRRLRTECRRPDGPQYAQLVAPFPHATEIVGIEHKGSLEDLSLSGRICITAIPHPTSRVLLSTSCRISIAQQLRTYAEVHIVNLSALSLVVKLPESVDLDDLKSSPTGLSQLRSLTLGRPQSPVTDTDAWIAFLHGVPLIHLDITFLCVTESQLKSLMRGLPTLRSLRIHVMGPEPLPASFGTLLSLFASPQLQELELDVKMAAEARDSLPCTITLPQVQRPTLPLRNLQSLTITLISTPPSSILHEALWLSQYIPPECSVTLLTPPDHPASEKVSMWSDLLAKERRTLSCTRTHSGGWCQLGKQVVVKRELQESQ